MPSHYGGSKPKRGGKKKTNAQRLKEHSKHHTKKHIDMMRKDMKAGMSFTAAHKKAQKLVGK